MKRHRDLYKRVPSITLPTDIYLYHKNIELYFYYFYTNRMTFLHKNPYKMTFLEAANCTSKSSDNTIKELNTVDSMQKTRGFNMYAFHVDNKFNLNDLREHIRPESLNNCEKGKHIIIIESSTQNTNQVKCCTTHYVTYNR